MSLRVQGWRPFVTKMRVSEGMHTMYQTGEVSKTVKSGAENLKDGTG